jgi:hypothetical protein
MSFCLIMVVDVLVQRAHSSPAELIIFPTRRAFAYRTKVQ